jgi:hypothetical protein
MHPKINEIKLVPLDDDIFTVTKPCIIAYQPSEKEINLKSQDEESGFAEMISDFLYHSGNIKSYLSKKKIKIVNTSGKIINVRLAGKEPFTIITSEYAAPVGFIFVNSHEEPKVMPGAETSAGLLQEINNYFKLK